MGAGLGVVAYPSVPGMSTRRRRNATKSRPAFCSCRIVLGGEDDHDVENTSVLQVDSLALDGAADGSL